MDSKQKIPFSLSHKLNTFTKKKKRKKSCIHLLLQDSQTCRHPTLPSPLSTRVERSVGSDRLPPNPIKMTPNLLPSFQKKQANVSSPHEKRKKKNSSLGYTPWKNRTAVQSKPRKGAQPTPGDTLPSPRTDGPFAADVSGSPGLFSSHSRAVQTAIRPACGGTVLKILQWERWDKKKSTE